jgi:arsenite methyltransferase
MNSNAKIKEVVKERYSIIAGQTRQQNVSSCCGAMSNCCSDDAYNIMAEEYSGLNGYVSEADLGLGCGLPTEFAHIREGDTVIDLGSGAGNDVFVARRVVGEKGKLIGIDFTEAMIARARENAEKLHYNNVEFRFGDIEDMPVTANKADVIISNCVLNLAPNKHKVFSEIYRVLKPGGHFCISDIVLEGEIPAKWKEVAELYAGCISGAVQKQSYLDIITESGFGNIALKKDKTIAIPDEVLSTYLTEEEISEYKSANVRIASITVSADKPAKDSRNCCEPGNGCC